MKTTASNGFKKPDYTDKIDIAELNNNMDKLDNSIYPTVIATGTNSYVGATSSIVTLNKGTKLTLFVGIDATGNCALNLNAYGAKNIKDSFGNIVTNLKANIPYNLCYNGTDFILQGKGGGGNVTPDKMLSGVTATSNTGLVVGNIPSKAAATINPSTVAQTIAAGQYLSGDQIIAAITGTATDADVVAGKTYNSAAGILRTGTASIASLGGKGYAEGTRTLSGITSTTAEQVYSGLSFIPSMILYKFPDGSVYAFNAWRDSSAFYGMGGSGSVRGSATSDGFKVTYSNNGTFTWRAWE